MPKRRYLAPWMREEEGLVVGTELDEEALGVLRGKRAIYHCISRVVGRQFVFEDREKEKFVALMRCYEGFCEVRVLAHCVMSNHFHILVEVPSPPPGRGRDWTDERFLEHLGALYSEHQMAEIRWWLEHYRGQGADRAAEEYRDKYFRRMWDLSEFMKPLKQCFSRWFNTTHGRCGTLWEERFKSVLVEDGHAARVVSAYIDLNPVRARMVEDPEDYRWSSYGEAIAGAQRARDGIQRVMVEGESARGGKGRASGILTSWRQAVGSYRKVLYAHLNGDTAAGRSGRPAPGLGGALMSRVRAFSDGVVFGKDVFLDATFQMTRDWFGPKRKDGARKLHGVETELRTMRNLRPKPSA